MITKQSFTETSSWNRPRKIGGERPSWSFSSTSLSLLECAEGSSAYGRTMLTISNSPISLLVDELSVDEKSLGDITSSSEDISASSFK